MYHAIGLYGLLHQYNYFHPQLRNITCARSVFLSYFHPFRHPVFIQEIDYVHPQPLRTKISPKTDNSNIFANSRSSGRETRHHSTNPSHHRLKPSSVDKSSWRRRWPTLASVGEMGGVRRSLLWRNGPIASRKEHPRLVCWITNELSPSSKSS